MKAFTIYIQLLCDFLKIDHLPLPPFQLVVANCLKELYLPKDFYSIVCQLTNRVPICKTDSRFVRYQFAMEYDSVALAYVLTAMKLVFNIEDSKSENKIEKLVEKLENYIGESLYSFSFMKWLPNIERLVAVVKQHYEEIELESREENERKDLLRDVAPTFDEARKNLRKRIEADFEVQLRQKLLPSQRTDHSKTEVKLKNYQNRLCDFRTSRSVIRAITSFDQLKSSYRLENLSDTKRDQVEDILKDVQSVLANSKSSNTPFDCSFGWQSLEQTSPHYFRLLKTSCDAVIPTVNLSPKYVHQLVCIIEAYASGKPNEHLPNGFCHYLRKKFFESV